MTYNTLKSCPGITPGTEVLGGAARLPYFNLCSIAYNSYTVQDELHAPGRGRIRREAARARAFPHTRTDHLLDFDQVDGHETCLSLLCFTGPSYSVYG